MTTLIDCDLPCLCCGYNLRTQPEGGRCPECNLEVAVTLAAPRLPEKLLRWFPRGCWLIAASLTISFVLWPLASVAVARLSAPYEQWRIQALLHIAQTAITGAGIVVAWWMLICGARADPRSRLPRWLPSTVWIGQLLYWLFDCALAVQRFFIIRALLTPTYGFFPMTAPRVTPLWRILTMIPTWLWLGAMFAATALALWFLWNILRSIGCRIMPVLFVLIMGGHVCWIGVMRIALSPLYRWLSATPATAGLVSNLISGAAILLGLALIPLWVIVALRFRVWARGGGPIAN